MDSIPLEMDDIFDEHEGGSHFNPERLPDLEDELEPMRDNDDEAARDGQPITDDPELLAQLKSLKGASKNKTKRTIPKLDEARLTGERGIPAIPKIFAKVPLRGKHHEVEDLKMIMRHMEHWGHRLFPKMPFAEVLDRCERLGLKRGVQTCVKRIRLDMPVLPEDFQEDDAVERTGDVDNEGETVERMGSDQDDGETTRNNDFEIDEEEIEDLLREQEEHDKLQQDPGADGRRDEPHQISQKSKPVDQPAMSDEIKARIERNKQLALERKAARLSKTSSGENPVRADQDKNISSNELTQEEDDLPPGINTAHSKHVLKDLSSSDKTRTVMDKEDISHIGDTNFSGIQDQAVDQTCLSKKTNVEHVVNNNKEDSLDETDFVLSEKQLFISEENITNQTET